MEVLLANQYTPQLIRHVQILWRGLNDAKVKTYLKIGTTGTGGMGLNIPYTHSRRQTFESPTGKIRNGGGTQYASFPAWKNCPRRNGRRKALERNRNIKPPAPIIKDKTSSGILGRRSTTAKSSDGATYSFI